MLLTALLSVGACGKKADTPKAKDDAAKGPTAAPLAMPTSGVEAIRRMNFTYGSEGSDAYRKALVAYKAKPHDWAGVKTHCETALAKDGAHIGAHWLYGLALAQAGDHAAAVDHLVAAISADYWRYGAQLDKEEDLKTFLGTPHGAAVLEVAGKIHDDYKKRASVGLWLVGRRSTFKWPEKPGAQSSTTRGELYAFDRETKRYLRLTHTDDQVAGFVRSTSGSEVVVVGFDKIDRPKGDDPTPLVTHAFVQAFDTTEWNPIGQKTTLATPARELAVGYGEGDRLLVAAAPPNGRWGIGAPVISSIDRSTGKLTKVGAALPVPRVVFSLEEGRVVRAPQGIKAAWTGDPPTAPSLEIGGKQIAIPESGAAAQSTVASSPDGARVAFATAVDPCAKDVAPSLYVVDAKTGALKHLLTAKSRFTTRWLDATTLAYEDGDGAIRLWDATTAREIGKLENKPGLALDVLSLAPAPLCKQAPPTADQGSGSADEPMPPEEGSAGGPVTTPNP
ncbi:MAG TPA: hypothetical protein VFQ53_14220 [Kofleriaceae bacterium]|nr:hypothetical protein [Kofleriaceae bacterium]